ncbi:MAG: BrnT family toxin [Oceanobacter sp.]
MSKVSDRKQKQPSSIYIQLDGVTATLFWSDPDLLQIQAKTSDFPRYLVIGKVEGQHWSAITDSPEWRSKILSARRSREEEVYLYECGRI